MLLEIGDPAQAVHEVIGTPAFLFTRMRSTSTFETETKSDPDSIHESSTWFGVSSRDQIMLDSSCAFHAVGIV